MKVGVMIPTYKRPDLARRAALQWIAQTRKPDLLCFHQNGSEESYEWAVEDLKSFIPIKWVHVAKTLPQSLWYLVPLTHLIEQNCDVYLWGDHDDIYFSNHVETVILNLQTYDVTVSNTCGVLYVKDKGYKYTQSQPFTVNPTGGMASSMAFNKPFARHLQHDLAQDKSARPADNVLAYTTMPKHKTHVSSNVTTVYVSHPGTVSTPTWADHFVQD